MSDLRKKLQDWKSHEIMISKENCTWKL